MKKLIYAAGVLSLGGASLVVQAAEGGSKPWSISATAEGFYDDNINTAPNGPSKVASWGAYISPSATYVQAWNQSSLNFSAAYGAYYYGDVKNAYGEDTLDSNWSQTVNFDVAFKHTFNPKISLALDDNFQVFQNANQVLMGQTGRINGNNIGNNGKADLIIELTPRWSVDLGYQNVWYHYQQAQYAALLDRVENYGKLDFRYLIQPTMVGVVGGKIGSVAYNGDIPLYGPGSTTSEFKNNTTYFAYAGLDETFTPNLTGSLRAGAEIQDFNNLPAYYVNQDSTQVNPYVDISLTYAYGVGSSAQAGVIHRSNASSGSSYAGSAALEQESTAFYLNVTQAFTAKLTGTLTGTFQSSEFVGGLYNGQNQDWWSVGAKLSYAFTHHLSAQVSYYYDLLTDTSAPLGGSTIPGYTRNRVFFGVTATY